LSDAASSIPPLDGEEGALERAGWGERQPHPDAAFGVVGPPHKGEVWSKWRLRAALPLRAVMTK
jgi:hypothetical protein